MPGNMTDGFHLVVEALKLNGVDTIYGVAGIPITDLLRLAQAEGIRYFGFRHEQSAGNAAAIAGYLTQKPGICMTVSAPGFLNGMVALANATTNCFPMVMISGSSDRAIVDLEQGDYEEMDQLAAARPYAKAAYRVNRPQDIGIGIARAIRAAVSGRPGGVYLDLTAEVLGSALDVETAKKSLVKVVDPAPPQPPAPESVARAIELLANAQRPLVILGKGAAYARADEEIRSFIETTGIPFLPMSMAKGLLARRPSAIGGRRPLLCDRQRRCRDVRRGAPQLAVVARPAAAVVREARGLCRSISRRPKSTATGRSPRRSSATSSRLSRRSTPR